jgi:DNA-binding transcriptional LysR family regulator
VAACGTTVAAARSLNMTQATVSKALARLEADLGTALFERRRGRLTIPPRNDSLFQAVLHVADRFDGLSSGVEGLRSGSGMPLRVSSTPSIGQDLIAQVISRLVALAPRTRVDLRIGDPVADVKTGVAELGVVFSPSDQPDLVVDRLLSTDLTVLLQADDPFAKRSRLGVADLARRDLICFDRTRSPLGRLVAEWFEAGGETYRPFVEVPYCITAAHLVSAGCGLAIVDAFAAEDECMAGLITRPLSPAIAVEVCLIRQAGRASSDRARQFCEILSEVAEAHRAADG